MSSLLNNYARKKISFLRGKGCYLYSTNGKKYLDFVQGIAVNSLGHCHDHLVNAINNKLGNWAESINYIANATCQPSQQRNASVGQSSSNNPLKFAYVNAIGGIIACLT